MADIPHFSYPFRFAGGAAVVVEQDTADEITDCVRAVLLTPQGFRTEVPGFGIPDPVFAESAPDATAIEGALATWEPRAQALVGVERDRLDALISRLTVRVGAGLETS